MTAQIKAGSAPVEPLALPDDNLEPLPFNQRPPMFRAFEWAESDYTAGVPEAVVARDMTQLGDLAAGAALVLEMLYADDLSAESHHDLEDAPLIGHRDRSKLMRMAIAAFGLIADKAAERLEAIQEAQALRKGGAT